MECLRELNSEFDVSFPSYSYSTSISICLLISIQISTVLKNESIEFMRLEELKEPRVKSIDGEEGYEW